MCSFQNTYLGQRTNENVVARDIKIILLIFFIMNFFLFKNISIFMFTCFFISCSVSHFHLRIFLINSFFIFHYSFTLLSFYHNSHMLYILYFLLLCFLYFILLFFHYLDFMNYSLILLCPFYSSSNFPFSSIFFTFYLPSSLLH